MVYPRCVDFCSLLTLSAYTHAVAHRAVINYCATGGSARDRRKCDEPLGGHPQRRMEAEVGHVSERACSCVISTGWLMHVGQRGKPNTLYFLLGQR